jgi:hypothetical protein
LGRRWVASARPAGALLKPLFCNALFPAETCLRNDGVRCSSHLSGTTLKILFYNKYLDNFASRNYGGFPGACGHPVHLHRSRETRPGPADLPDSRLFLQRPFLLAPVAMAIVAATWYMASFNRGAPPIHSARPARPPCAELVKKAISSLGHDREKIILCR